MNLSKLLGACTSENIYYYESKIDNFDQVDWDRIKIDLPYDNMSYIYKSHSPENDSVYYAMNLEQADPEKCTVSIDRTITTFNLDLGETLLFDIDIKDNNVSKIEVRNNHRCNEEQLQGWVKETVCNIKVSLSELTHILREKETVQATKKQYANKKRSPQKIVNVTYITNKNYISDIKGHKEMNWTYSFSVCGHWRKTTGIGKNRSNVYCVDGFTWVRPCIKNKDLEYINKLKVVK